MAEQPKTDMLTDQILQLVDYITKIKSELAAIKHPKSSVDHFNTVAEQLNTICQTTEEATNDIMESAENVLNAVDELSANVKYPDAQASCTAIMDSTNKIFESCSFHDLTGQRISKIVRIMNRLESTLDSLVEIVGPDGVADMPVDGDETIEDIIGMRDGDVAMHGPQATGQEVSQNDIDALFGPTPTAPPVQASQDDIDSMFDTPATPAPTAPTPSAPLAQASQADIDSMFDAPAAPAPAASTVSQDAIDSMFDAPATAPAVPEPDPSGKKEVSQDDIDKLFG